MVNSFIDEFKRDYLKLYWEKINLSMYGNPVIVYQMPKTGSGSITHSLKKHGVKNVFHLHEITPNHHYPKYTHQIAKSLYNLILEQHLPVKIITATREPISMSVSNFFQQLYSKKGRIYENESIRERVNKGNLTISDLIDIFLSSYPHNYALKWFDDNVKNIFNIDVYSQTFPKEEGFLWLKNDNIDLITIKSENDDSVKEKYISELLCLKDFKIERTNITTEKKFNLGNKYSEFRKEIKFSEEYINSMYDSKYTKHFYTEMEIEKFKSFWDR